MIGRLRSSPAWHLVWLEYSFWRSQLFWLLRRRPGAGPDDRAFGHLSLMLPAVLTILGVSIIEVVALELILPWESVRRVALVLGIWGVLWVVGLLAAPAVHPHLVGPSGLRVRNSTTLDAHVPWSDVAVIRRARRTRGPCRSRTGCCTSPSRTRRRWRSTSSARSP